MTGQQRLAAALGVVVALVLSLSGGCGENSDLGTVAGIVTLDGQPLANATVEFVPADGGEERSSYDGTTDASGRYELYFSASKKGATPGAYTVRIWPPDSEDEPATAPVPKRPPRYSTRSELTATVEVGSNSIDFPLDSQGQILRR
ncbi:MAG: carboxypeptidase regulatory-like domain-containing protein [Candidatus Anammoximicrobium sp.]|nr:carboxypeptidase regulatory-like domain-containing protein [Candidatus Anammoximicrobium sp.]